MKKKENVLINDFIKEYNTLKNEETKVTYVKSIMKRTYCPIIEKKAALEKMLEISVGEGKVPYLDMITSKINFTMTILVLYTKLVVEKNEDGLPKADEAYDLLVKGDLLNTICNIIGEREFNELMSINEAAINTWHNKNASVEAYVSKLFETAVDRFGVVAGVGAQQLVAFLDNEQKMEKLLKLLEKTAKKIK